MSIYGDFKWDAQVLLVTYPEFEPTAAEYQNYLKRLDEHFAQKDSFYIIYDASKSKYLSSENRVLQSNWVKKNDSILKSKVKRMTFVIPGMGVRLVLKTILAFSPLPCPNDVVSSLEDAYKGLLVNS